MQEEGFLLATEEGFLLVQEEGLILVQAEDLLLVQEEDVLLVQEEGCLPLSILGQSGKSSLIFPSSSNATHAEVLPAQCRFSSRFVGGVLWGRPKWCKTSVILVRRLILESNGRDTSRFLAGLPNTTDAQGSQTQKECRGQVGG